MSHLEMNFVRKHSREQAAAQGHLRCGEAATRVLLQMPA